MIAAAKNYSEYCKLMGYDQKFMKHAATFLGPNSPFAEFVDSLPEDIGGTVKYKGGGMNGTDKQDNGQPTDRFREIIGFNE